MKASLFKDLARSGWHSSIMTTYSVDPAFYDGSIEYRLCWAPFSACRFLGGLHHRYVRICQVSDALAHGQCEEHTRRIYSISRRREAP
jgi:hypothetical protein